MTVNELIFALRQWDGTDEVVVKFNGEEYSIIDLGTYADYSDKEGGDSPAIIIETKF